MTKQEVIKELKRIANCKKETNIVRDVAGDIAYHLYSYQRPKDFFKNLANNGCKSGIVNTAIFTGQTYKFFDKYYQEIMVLVKICKFSKPVNQFLDLKNDLAWFAYEEVARQLAENLGI